MTHHFHINAKFKVVTVRLLIPQNDNSVLDRLIDHRGDHPDAASSASDKLSDHEKKLLGVQ